MWVGEDKICLEPAICYSIAMSIGSITQRQVLDLRRKKRSYNDIAKILGISKSTVSYWASRDLESQKVKKILIIKNRIDSRERIKRLIAINKIKWEKWREQARREARRQFGELSKGRLFIAGIMLYWAEGDGKPKNPVRFTNTDPRMVALYIKFLVGALKIPIESLRITIILYPDLSQGKCEMFWSKTVNIPKTQFYKTQFIKGRHKTTRLPYGICMVTASGRRLKEKILIWIDLLSKTL